MESKFYQKVGCGSKNWEDFQQCPTQSVILGAGSWYVG